MGVVGGTQFTSLLVLWDKEGGEHNSLPQICFKFCFRKVKFACYGTEGEMEQR